MKKIEVPKGTKFGRLTIVKEVAKIKGERAFKVRCDCLDRTVSVVRLFSLRSGNTKSCGCLSIEYLKDKNTNRIKNTIKANKKRSDTSGRHHSLFYTRVNMMKRCNNEENPDFKRYGGRGIKVCKSWSLSNGEGFWNFVKWAESNGWYEGCNLQIDRRDNDKGYSPKNCRWVTSKINNRNRSNNTKYKYKGKLITSFEIVEKYGIKGLKARTFSERVRNGWSIEEALTRPPKKVNN